MDGGDGQLDGDEKFDRWAWPNWNFHPDRPVRLRSRREVLGSVLWPGIFLFYLAQPVSAVFDGRHAPWLATTVLVTVVLFALSYLGVIWRGWASSHLARSLMIGWLSLFPIGLALLLGPDMLTFFTYAISPALMLLPANIGAAYGLLCAVALLGTTRVVQGAA